MVRQYDRRQTTEMRSSSVWRAIRRSCRKQAGIITRGAKSTSKPSGGESQNRDAKTDTRLKKEMELEDETFGFPTSDTPAEGGSPEVHDDLENESDALQSAIIDSLDDLELEESAKKPR